MRACRQRFTITPLLGYFGGRRAGISLGSRLGEYWTMLVNLILDLFFFVLAVVLILNLALPLINPKYELFWMFRRKR